MAYTVPDLPYDYNALEPHIDEATMRVHHDKHHQAYVDKANAALEGTEWADKPIEEVLKNLDKLGDKATAVRNNGGGHYNHSLFWEWMSPDGGGEPEGELAEAIESAFGSFSTVSGGVQERRRQPVRLRLGVARARRQRAGGRLDARTRTTRSRTARRRCSASTSGSTPTTSSTRTGDPTTSTPGGTSSTGRRSPRATPRSGALRFAARLPQRAALRAAAGVVGDEAAIRRGGLGRAARPSASGRCRGRVRSALPRTRL